MIGPTREPLSIDGVNMDISMLDVSHIHAGTFLWGGHMMQFLVVYSLFWSKSGLFRSENISIRTDLVFSH